MQFYSCDSHVVEGREVFDGLAERFGEGEVLALGVSESQPARRPVLEWLRP